MAVLISGDFHAGANNELSTISKKTLVKEYGQENFDKIHYHIILGDCGFMRQGNEKTDRFNYKTLAFRPFPILCVQGNHDPIYGIKNLHETDIGIGENVYQINDVPFTAYLKRGKIYTIDGIKFLVLGGALSVDKDIRVPNKTWWENEYWSEKEKHDLFKLLEQDNSFDNVVSHTGPRFVNNILFSGFSSFHEKSSDEVAILNNEIHEKIHFTEWSCGHWHSDRYWYDDISSHSFRYFYRTTKIIEKTNNELFFLNKDVHANDDHSCDFYVPEELKR